MLSTNLSTFLTFTSPQAIPSDVFPRLSVFGQLGLSFIWGYHHLHLVGMISRSANYFITCYTVQTRPNKVETVVSTVAILGFQFAPSSLQAFHVALTYIRMPFILKKVIVFVIETFTQKRFPPVSTIFFLFLLLSRLTAITVSFNNHTMNSTSDTHGQTISQANLGGSI